MLHVSLRTLKHEVIGAPQRAFIYIKKNHFRKDRLIHPVP